MHSLFAFLVFMLFVFSPFQLHADDKAIKIGVLTTLTGSSANYGENTQSGMSLALEEINSSGGVLGQPLEIVYEGYSFEKLREVASSTSKLVNHSKVTALLTLFAEDTEIAWPIAKGQGVLTMTYAAGSRDITKGRDLLFRVWPSDEELIRKVLRHANAKGKSQLCILTEQSAYFESMREVALDEWKVVQKKSSVLDVEYSPPVQDFLPYIQKLADCETVLLLAGQNYLGNILQKVSERKLQALLLTYHALSAPIVLDIAKSAANGVIFASYLPAEKSFREKFVTRYGREPSYPASAAYDAVKILANVMNRKGSETKNIIAGLEELKDYPGASGKITFTKDHDRATLESELWTIKDGKLLLWSDNE